MDIQFFSKEFLKNLHGLAAGNERKRMNFDLRTSPNDTSQRMLNALEVGTSVPIHRHLQTSETVVCLEGCLDWVFYEQIKKDTAANTEFAENDDNYREICRYRVNPSEGIYGIQVPLGIWHSIEVHEASTIFEAKDGAYGK